MIYYYKRFRNILVDIKYELIECNIVILFIIILFNSRSPIMSAHFLKFWTPSLSSHVSISTAPPASP